MEHGGQVVFLCCVRTEEERRRWRRTAALTLAFLNGFTSAGPLVCGESGRRVQCVCVCVGGWRRVNTNAAAAVWKRKAIKESTDGYDKRILPVYSNYRAVVLLLFGFLTSILSIITLLLLTELMCSLTSGKNRDISPDSSRILQPWFTKNTDDLHPGHTGLHLM